MHKLISEIHFSLHSILVDEELRKLFYIWISGNRDNYSIIDYLNSPVTQSDFPEGITWHDVIEYSEGIRYENPRVTDIELEELRIKRIEISEQLFDRFLHEGLSSQKQQEIEEKWNSVFNSFKPVDYDSFDYSLAGYSGTLNGKPFVLHEQQKKGVAYLCSKENGLLAYDVGVGKTATGIVAVIHQLQHQKCLRPLIVVPKAVYSKWIHDTKELFPEIKVNELGNLNPAVIDELKMNSIFEEVNDGYLVAENSISICTAEALEKIEYGKNVMEQIIVPALETLVPAKKIEELFEYKQGTDLLDSLFFENLGIDLVLVDEAHRYKNLIRRTQKGSISEFSNLGFGEPSARALRMFALTEFIHRKNHEKNVFFLSATPFTNSPMEIYSMLRFLGGNEIVDLGYKNISDFLNEFAEIKIEWTVNNKGEVVRKTVMKNFRSLYAMQQLIQNYIDKVSAEDANIKRPDKETHVEKVEMTAVQKQIYEAEVHRIATAKSLGDVFKGINNMRMCMISPALVKQDYNDFSVPALNELVQSSPKLQLVCGTVHKLYSEKPYCGQIIYLPRGIKESKVLKEYLVQQGIPEKAIALINSSTTENQKQKITDAFNNPQSEVKILIGSETISEGVDLNGNTLVLYNCLLGWNPTEPIQVEGRLWRQGNLQPKVHIVYPLMYDSIDSLIYQKHDEKATRIDAVWNYRGDKINVEEINPEDLKFDLIKDPAKKADMLLEKEAIPIKRQLRIIDDSKDLIFTAEERIHDLKLQIEAYEGHIEDLKDEITKAQNSDAPAAFRSFSQIYIEEAEKEIQNYKNNISESQLKIKTIEAKLNKKLDAVLGENRTEQDLKNYLDELKAKKKLVQSKLPALNKKRSALVKQFTEEFNQQNEKIRSTSIQEIVAALTAEILDQ